MNWCECTIWLRWLVTTAQCWPVGSIFIFFFSVYFSIGRNHLHSIAFYVQFFSFRSIYRLVPLPSLSCRLPSLNCRLFFIHISGSFDIISEVSYLRKTNRAKMPLVCGFNMASIVTIFSNAYMILVEILRCSYYKVAMKLSFREHNGLHD